MTAFPKVVLVCGLLSLASSTTLAQAQPTCPETIIHSAAVPMVESRAGCPLSAVIETESTQTMADGTKIQKKKKELVYRDSSGRIRYEVHYLTDIDKDAPHAPNGIAIGDPVTGFGYSLMPEFKVAVRFRLFVPSSTADASQQPQHSTTSAAVSPSAQEPQPKWRIRPKNEVVEEQLEPQQMEGLRATGTRTTMTMPARDVGHYMLIRETWRSPEMGIILLQESTVPSSGTFNRKRMTNLARSEPTATLFQVPTNYTIKDAPPMRTSFVSH